MFNRNFITTIVALVIIAIGVMMFRNNNNPTPIASNSISPTASSSVSVSPSPKQSGKVTVTKLPPTTYPIPSSLVNKLHGPATCSLAGTATFLQPNIYDNGNAMFTYKGIDSSARLITWTITPNDDIKVGPNLFSGVPLPDGSSRLGISLPEHPKAKHYVLTAKVNYGRVVNANVEVKEATCAGSVNVDLSY